jgi:regulator of protease activity HflC (stomatin/prohibitin superfamily)
MDNLWIGYLLIFLIILMSMLFTVHQQTVAIIERFGRFHRMALPGLSWRIPLVERLAGQVNMRIHQIDVEIETKTQDDVFVHLVAAVQYRILSDKIYEAFYTLEDPQQQIRAFVFDVVRARVPSIKLDDVFAKKDDIAISVRRELKDVMSDFGYDILQALVTDIQPDSRVKTAMNEINESQRLRIAALERGEADKIIKIKQAEAESESKILQGQGIAGQRKAIVEGLREALTDFQRDLPDSSAKDAMTLVLMGQYFDTLKEMGASGKATTILLPHAPSSLHDLTQQMQATLFTTAQK